MRWIVCTKPSVSCRERKMRSSVWQPTQFRRGPLLLRRAGRAVQPLRVRHLRGEVFGPDQLEIGGSGAPGGHLRRGCAGEVVPDGADTEGVLARLEAGSREAVAAFFVAHHRDRLVRALASRVHEDAFHDAFFRGRNRADQRVGLGRRGQRLEHDETKGGECRQNALPNLHGSSS
jgi:hypothetical protein